MIQFMCFHDFQLSTFNYPLRSFSCALNPNLQKLEIYVASTTEICYNTLYSKDIMGIDTHLGGERHE